MPKSVGDKPPQIGATNYSVKRALWTFPPVRRLGVIVAVVVDFTRGYSTEKTI